MNDAIAIRGLRLKTRIGVSERERSSPQVVVIDVEIQADLGRAGKSDDLAHTIDYSSVVSAIAELVQSSESKLLEHLAEQIAERIRSLEDAGGIVVEVRKQSPPVAYDVDALAVRIERPAK